MLEKLLLKGISGKFFNVIRNIYTRDKTCVRQGSTCSEFFGLNLGVRQGCILSPLLFNIFLSDLAEKLNSLGGKFDIGELSLNSLFWADDLVLFAKSEKDLDTLLETLEKYCKENELTINVKKTKCMTFNNTGRRENRPFFLDGKQLENVRSYKYLGFILTPSGEITSGLTDLKDRALKAFMKLKGDLGSSFNENIPLSLKLIDTLIKPILLYASDFWGPLKLPKNNPIENLHMHMCKRLIGVQKQTTNLAVLLELGRVPLSLESTKLAIKNWERIKGGQANPILINSLKDAEEHNLPWVQNIRGILERNGLLALYLGNHTDKKPFIYKKLYERMSDIFHQDSFSDIRNQEHKLRTYSLFKKEIGFEKYLIRMKNVPKRTQITKFRLSNHRLMIEIKRHDKTPKEKRFCPFCINKVEDECHFLLECPQYTHLREIEVLPILESPKLTNLSKPEKFGILMSELSIEVTNLINNSLDLREFLLSKPKLND